MKLTTAFLALFSLSTLPLNSAAPMDASSSGTFPPSFFGSSSTIPSVDLSPVEPADVAVIPLCSPPPDHFPSPFDSAAGLLTFTIVGGLLIAGQWIFDSITGCHWSPVDPSPIPVPAQPAPSAPMVIDFSNSNVADGTVPVVKRAENLEISMGDFDIGYTQLLFGEHGSFAEYDDHLTEEPGVVMPNMAEMPGSMPVVPGPPAIPGPPPARDLLLCRRFREGGLLLRGIRWCRFRRFRRFLICREITLRCRCRGRSRVQFRLFRGFQICLETRGFRVRFQIMGDRWTQRMITGSMLRNIRIEDYGDGLSLCCVAFVIAGILYGDVSSPCFITFVGGS